MSKWITLLLCCLLMTPTFPNSTILDKRDPGTIWTRGPKPALDAGDDTGSIAGIVTGQGGTPLAGVWVGAGDYQSMLGCGGSQFGAQTDNSGAYEINVPAGTYLLFVNSHNDPGAYVPEAYQDINSWSQIADATPITVAAGQAVTGVSFSLPDGLA